MSDDAVSPSAPIPRIRLAHLSEQLVVYPPADAPQDFRPFSLPRLPRSLVAWMGILMDTFHDEHGRCMAMLLLMDPKLRAWVPRLPRQSCFADAVRWGTAQTDVPNLPPGLRLVGTCQSTLLDDIEPLRTEVPPSDGVHLFYSVRDTPPAFRHFVRSDGMAHPTAPERLQLDDWQLTLTACRSRMELQ